LQLQEFKDLVEEMWKFKAFVDAEEVNLKNHKENLDKMKVEILAYLDKTDLASFDSISCKVIKANMSSIATPKTIEDKKALFGYIAHKYGDDALTGYLSINSQSLNKFFKMEDEQAAKEGNFDFVMPGVAAPVHYTQLRVNKK